MRGTRLPNTPANKQRQTTKDGPSPSAAESQTDRHLKTYQLISPHKANRQHIPSINPTCQKTQARTRAQPPANPACEKDLALPAATPRGLYVAKALKAVNRKAESLLPRNPGKAGIAGNRRDILTIDREKQPNQGANK